MNIYETYVKKFTQSVETVTGVCYNNREGGQTYVVKTKAVGSKKFQEKTK